MRQAVSPEVVLLTVALTIIAFAILASNWDEVGSAPGKGAMLSSAAGIMTYAWFNAMTA
jgi:hypothetical protein